MHAEARNRMILRRDICEHIQRRGRVEQNALNSSEDVIAVYARLKDGNGKRLLFSINFLGTVDEEAKKTKPKQRSTTRKTPRYQRPLPYSSTHNESLHFQDTLLGGSLSGLRER